MEEVSHNLSNGASQSSLLTALDALFAGTSTTATTRIKKVEFRYATMKNLRGMIEVVSAALGSLSDQEMSSLLEVVAQVQKNNVKAGKSATEMKVEDVVEMGKCNLALVQKMVYGCLDVLPQWVSELTNLTADEYDQLLIDEAFLVPVGIVAVNYPFFTQSLLPAFAVTFASAAKNKAPAQAQKKK